MKRIWILGLTSLLACGGRSNGGPAPVPGFGMLGGQRVLVLPVHYAQPVAGGWVGGASAGESLRRLNAEIAFALGERKGTTQWVLPEEIAAALARQPAVDVHVYGLSADPVRRASLGRAERVKDPLYGEIRRLAALFDTRYAVFPVELWYEPARAGYGGEGRAALWTLLLDARTGFVLWSGLVRGEPGAATSERALVHVAEAFARQLVP